MDYKKFEDNVRMDLPKSLLGTFPHISVEPAEVTKLQGMSYSGISVRQEGSQMSMTINLDSFYRDYESGAVYEDVLQGITDYVVTHISQTPEFDLDMLKSYESMRPYLTVQMVEKNRNAEKLAEVPHEIVEDMAVVYRFQLGDLPDGVASVLITNPMLEHYGITQEQLHQDALEMVQKNEPLSIKNMDEIMYEMTNGFMGSLDEASSPMYIATNASRMNGAVVRCVTMFVGSDDTGYRTDYRVFKQKLMSRDDLFFTPEELMEELESMCVDQWEHEATIYEL